MPPRYAYWTILAGGLPTSFRAAEREDLLPTLHRLKQQHPDAEMRWFARGKLWSSPEAARARPPVSAPRGRDWRPGGEHKDPRARYQVAKQQRNQSGRARRFQRKHGEVVNAPDPEGRRPRPIPSAGTARTPGRPAGANRRPPSTKPGANRRPPSTKPGANRRPPSTKPGKGGRGR
jgi:hypothetical protein